MNLFGFEIKRYKPAEDIPSIAPKVTDDGAILINTTAGGPLNSGVYLDLEGTVKSESELITKYRDMALHPEIDMAIDEVVNEAIVSEEGEKTVQIILDDVPIDDKIKDILVGEFDEVLKLLDFQTMSYEVFRRWYIDGRLYYLVIIDPKTQSQILELRYLDPRKIRKIKQIAKSKDKKTAAVLSKLDTEYYIYSDKGLMSGPSVQNYNVTSTSNGIKIAKDSIIFVTSGLTNTVGTMVLSYLHKAIKPLNMLRSMEDSCVIYRISRAPERRIFYIDVGNMPRFKAEQYVKDIAASYKNKIVYNAETGTVQDDRRFLTMLDDFFIPRREGGKGTQIDTLPAGQNLGQIEDIKYFQNKLYSALNVPVGRLNPEYTFDIGRSTQISRDEVKFSKFVDRLRLRFSELFLTILERNLVLKRVLSPDDWDQISHLIKFKFHQDNCFSELKDIEIQTGRYNMINLIQPYIGRFVSNIEIRKQILKQDDKSIQQIDQEIRAEAKNPQYMPPPEEDGKA